MKLVRYSIISLLFLALISSCKKKEKEADAPASGVDREAMLTYIADEIIVPSYSNFSVSLDAMTAKSKAFTDNPSANTLADFRGAWEAAYINWQKVELFDVGPAEIYGLRFFFNIYPATINENATLQGINQNIETGTANLNVASSYSAQGFSALDYLLNGVGANDTEILAYYTTDASAAKRLAYVTKITDQMKYKFDNVYAQWTSGYRDRFISKTGTDISSSTSLLVNGIVLHYERYIRSGKFGIPAGAMVSGKVLPTSVEAYYKKDLGLKLAKTAHQAFIDFFNGKSVKTGTEGLSFKTYLDAIGAQDAVSKKSLAEIINDQFVVVGTKLNALNADLSSEVQNNNAAMIAVYTEMQTAVRMLKVDMTSAMSITITYTDNDGD